MPLGTLFTEDESPYVLVNVEGSTAWAMALDTELLMEFNLTETVELAESSDAVRQEYGTIIDALEKQYGFTVPS
jgi:hypothetical protein